MSPPISLHAKPSTLRHHNCASAHKPHRARGLPGPMDIFLNKPCLLLAGSDNLRRYEIAEVRRKGLQTGRSLPRGYLQADLDVVHPPGLPPPDKLLAEAELIKASAHHCCCSLPSLGPYATRSLYVVVVRSAVEAAGALIIFKCLRKARLQHQLQHWLGLRLLSNAFARCSTPCHIQLWQPLQIAQHQLQMTCLLLILRRTC